MTALWLLKPTVADEAVARRVARREALIQISRRKIAEYDGDHLNGFLPWFENQEEYMHLSPHLDQEKLFETMGAKRKIVTYRGSVIDVGRAFITSEVNRLAREWEID